MPSKVRHQVDGGQAYPVFQLTGVLDADTAPRIRSGLLGLLAEQPEAVVVDVRRLAVGDPGTVGVLREVARDVADWPGSHLLLLTAGPAAAAWQGAGLPVLP